MITKGVRPNEKIAKPLLLLFVTVQGSFLSSIVVVDPLIRKNSPSLAAQYSNALGPPSPYPLAAANARYVPSQLDDTSLSFIELYVSSTRGTSSRNTSSNSRSLVLNR